MLGTSLVMTMLQYFFYIGDDPSPCLGAGIGDDVTLSLGVLRSLEWERNDIRDLADKTHGLSNNTTKDLLYTRSLECYVLDLTTLSGRLSLLMHEVASIRDQLA